MNRQRSLKSIVIAVTVDHAITYHEDLATELVSTGWDVHFVSSGGVSLDSLDPRIEKHQLKMARNPKLFKDLVSLFQWIRLLVQIRPEVVVAGTPKASLLGMIAAKLTKVPHRIYWVHGLRLETATGKLRQLLLATEKITSWSATTLIAVSGSLKDHVIRLGIAETADIQVIGLGSTQGVQLQRFTRQTVENADLEQIGLIPGIPVIGFVGRLTVDKGIEELRQAAMALLEDGVYCQVLLVGPAEDEAGLTLADQLREVGINVVMTGRVSDTSSYYSYMDVFCLPSYREGLPNVVLEAFASETPVVSTFITGVVDVVEDRITGLLAEAKDIDGLTGALKEALTNEPLATEIAKNAFKFVKENFDSHVVVKKQADFLDKMH